jgi:hypothetical protein
VVCLLVLGYYAGKHPFGTYTTETDFYHYFAPDAERLAVWEFPENPYQGPGYPTLLALLRPIAGDLFTAGKWMSVVSGALIVLFSFVLFARLFGYWVGVGAQLIVVMGAQFPTYSLNATTDIPFVMLAMASLVSFTKANWSVGLRVVLSSVIVAAAYLVRYNGLFLVATLLLAIVLFNVFERGWRGRLVIAGAFLGVFLLACSPWLYTNYKHRGSPFYNTNHLNIATEFYPELADDSVFQEGTRKLTSMFGSFYDVLAHDPKRIAAHYPENLYEVASKTVVSRDVVTPWVGWFAVVGLVLALFGRPSKPLLVVVVSGVVYFLVQGLTHWETRYFLYIGVIHGGLSVFACARLLELIRARGWLKHRAFVAIALIPFGIMSWSSFTRSSGLLARFLASHPTEIIGACDFLKGQGATAARILARKPHLPAICGGEWVFFPTVKSLDELKVWLEKNHVDYLAFGVRELQARPELSALTDPEGAPEWLPAVWVSESPPFVLYRPAVGSLADQ